MSSIQRKKTLKTLFDSGALITSAKFQVNGILVIDHILQCCRLSIPSEVKRETVVSGLLFDYQDAKEIDKRISAGSIVALESTIIDRELDSVLVKIGLEGADRAVIQTCRIMSKQVKLVTDDHRLFVCATRLGLSPVFLVDLVALLVGKKLIQAAPAIEILRAIQSRYTKGFVELSVQRLKGVI